jgi:hypothetical protein
MDFSDFKNPSLPETNLIFWAETPEAIKAAPINSANVRLMIMKFKFMYKM